MKNNKIVNVILLFVFALSLKGFSQSAGVNLSEYQKLENDFVNEKVTTTQLDAFELRGLQKLNDFANYLTYISDNTMDETFREQAKQLALELFSNPETLFKYYQEGKVYETTIGIYLEHLLEQKKEKTKVAFLNVSKISATEKTEEGSYFWFVQYTEKQNKNDQTSSRAFVTLKIILKKAKKKFGSKTKFVWEVLLDEVTTLVLLP